MRETNLYNPVIDNNKVIRKYTYYLHGFDNNA